MLNKRKIYNPEEELKNLAPNLSSIIKENPFSVPEDYFEHLSSKLSTKISEPHNVEKNKNAKRMVSRSQFVYIMAAASIAIFISVFVLLNRNDSSENYLSGITLEQILEETPEIIESLDDYLLVEILVTISDDDIGNVYSDDLLYDSTLTNDEIIRFDIENSLSLL